MKEPLKVGDRVRTYGMPPEGPFPYQSPNTGIVVETYPTKICVQLDGTDGLDGAHVFYRQQVRRLVKKKRREWDAWVMPGNIMRSGYDFGDETVKGTGWQKIRVREVKS